MECKGVRELASTDRIFVERSPSKTGLPRSKPATFRKRERDKKDKRRKRDRKVTKCKNKKRNLIILGTSVTVKGAVRRRRDVRPKQGLIGTKYRVEHDLRSDDGTTYVAG